MNICPKCKREYLTSITYCKYCKIIIGKIKSFEQQVRDTTELSQYRSFWSNFFDEKFSIIAVSLIVIATIYVIFGPFLEPKQNTNTVNTSSKKSSGCYIYPSPEPWACTGDCSGHSAGYNWAKKNNIQIPTDCSGNSQSFIEGCNYYAEEYIHNLTLENCADYIDAAIDRDEP